MTTKIQTNVLRAELEAEEKATRKAEAMEILRQLSAKQLIVEGQRLDIERKAEKLEALRAEVFAAYESSDLFAINDARAKLTQLGF
jgi:hypothetical protein